MFFRINTATKKSSEEPLSDQKSLKTEQNGYSRGVQSMKTSLGKRSPLDKLPEHETLSREIYPRDDISSDIFKNKTLNKLNIGHGKLKKLKIQINGENKKTGSILEGGKLKIFSSVDPTRHASVLERS